MEVVSDVFDAKACVDEGACFEAPCDFDLCGDLDALKGFVVAGVTEPMALLVGITKAQAIDASELPFWIDVEGEIGAGVFSEEGEFCALVIDRFPA